MLARQANPLPAEPSPEPNFSTYTPSICVHMCAQVHAYVCWSFSSMTTHDTTMVDKYNIIYIICLCVYVCVCMILKRKILSLEAYALKDWGRLKARVHTGA